MKKFTFSILSLLVILGISGCGSVNKSTPKKVVKPTIYYTPEYIYSLEKVSPSFSKTNVKLNNKILSYEDKNIMISFKPKHKFVSFQLKNKTNKSFKILWDEVVYISYDNKSQGVIHNAIKYSKSNEPQLNTKVIPDTTINDIIVPKNNLIYFSGDGWYIRDMLSEEGKNTGTFNTDTKASSSEHASQFINKKIKIMIPIQIENKVIEYIFSFQVIGFKNIVFNRNTY